jgi:hypothetical protein
LSINCWTDRPWFMNWDGGLNVKTGAVGGRPLEGKCQLPESNRKRCSSTNK